MVALILDKLELAEGVEHIYTDYEVARDSKFIPESIILKSYRDKVNKNVIIFDEVLDANDKFYARARVMLSTGITPWSNMDIFTSSVVDNVDIATIIPSKISTPIITTDYKPDNHSPTMFTIYAGKYVSIGNNEHLSTTYLIEDIRGKVIWYSFKDTINKESITINNIILKPNNIYRLKAMFHALSGDSSQFGTITIYISNNDNLSLVTYLDDVDNSEDINLELSPVEIDSPRIRWEVYSLLDNIFSLVIDNTTDGINYAKLRIPAFTLKEDSNYLLKISLLNKDNEYRYIPFRSIYKYSKEKPTNVITDNTNTNTIENT